ncbi:hypothetical protein BCV70DRAFT_201395 [Testicularia cyperi]|uniref:Uncharacterized protein n=1 Tax=Testicularia cyperi TaxID=1882483 RepID=A0A317XM94_9BASI|nr:hypothetical protein BCV70DRAFT_201395 [Testicularia cyperi]
MTTEDASFLPAPAEATSSSSTADPTLGRNENEDEQDSRNGNTIPGRSNQASQQSPLSASTTARPAEITPTMSIALRITALQHLLTGTPAPLLAPSTSSTGSMAVTSTPTTTTTTKPEISTTPTLDPSVLARLTSVLSGLDQLSHSSRSISKFLHDWNSNEHILSPLQLQLQPQLQLQLASGAGLDSLLSTPVAVAVADSASASGSGSAPGLGLGTLTVSDLEKAHLALLYHPDLVELANSLDRINSAHHRLLDPTATKDLDRWISTATPKLQTLSSWSRQEAAQMQALQSRLLDFVASYQTYTTTVSEIFVSLDTQLHDLESTLSTLERRR